MATELDVEFNLDETLTINAEIKDPNGDAMDLTAMSGTDIQWGISTSKGGERLATLAISSGITVTAPSAGTITIRFSSADQDDLAPGRYFHECRVSHVTHGVSIQFEGKAKVLESMFAT